MRSDLDRGFMVTLKPRQGIHLTSCVQEALLLEGVLETWGDDLTGFKFVAPVVLSHTVTRLRTGKVPGDSLVFYFSFFLFVSYHI